jgi:hypothetical protein
MITEQLLTNILQEFAGKAALTIIAQEAALTIIADEFNYWRARYYRYPYARDDDSLKEATRKLDHLDYFVGGAAVHKVLYEAEECYAASVDPEDWALFKKKAEPVDQPVAGIADDLDPLALEFLPPARKWIDP